MKLLLLAAALATQQDDIHSRPLRDQLTTCTLDEIDTRRNE